MTPYKPMHIGDHALIEMRKALPHITRADVREIFERGVRRPAKYQQPGRAFRWEKSWVVTRRRKLAEMVYIEDATRVELVTVYWVGIYD
jgi:hypothetical protein